MAPDIKVDKLNARNYSTWKLVMMSLLKSRGLWHCVVENHSMDIDLSATKDEEETEEDKLDLIKQNEEAKHYMYASMDSTQIAATGACSNAYELWNKIKENHEGAEKDMQNNALADFLGFKYRKGESIIQYSGRFETALCRLTSTGYKVDENTKLWVYRNTLPKDIKTTVNTWTLSRPQGLVSELITQLKVQHHFDRLDNETETIALYGSESISEHRTKTNGNNNFNTNRGSQQRQNPNGNSCTYCKKDNHIWKDCRKLQADNKRKKNFATSRNNSSNNNGISHRKSDNQKSGAFMATEKNRNTTLKYGNNTWIIDSGATSHMTPRKDILNNYISLDEPISVSMGDGKLTEAYGKGSLHFVSNNFSGYLADVLWVPSLKENLFSVGHTLSQGYDVKFINSKSEVLFLKKEEVRLKGFALSSALFGVHLKPVPVDQTKSGETALVGTTEEDWHRRFAHASVSAIRELAKKDAVIGLRIQNSTPRKCEDCVMGKMCRTSHPPRLKTVADQNSAVLHFDTCGPLSDESLGGNKYFVLATEEYSNYRLIDFVTNKAQIPTIVKRLVSTAELETGRLVKMIVSDNGTEYANRDLTNWLNSKGVIHSFSCPYTPQQNGTAERANRTVIEGTRTLLNEAKLPETLWAEAANTTVYTTNRLLSPRDPDKTRYELYFGHKPDVSNLRAFGQRAIVYDNGRKSKLSTKGDYCRLVGYTSRSNTYRFYSEQFPDVFPSCDAVFLNENEVETIRNSNEDENTVTIRLQETERNNKSSRESDPNSDHLGNDYDDFLDATDQLNEETNDGAINSSSESSQSTEIYEGRELEDEATLALPGHLVETNDNQTNKSDNTRKTVAEERVTRLKAKNMNHSFTKPSNCPSWFWNPPGSRTVSDQDQTALFTLDDEPRTLIDAKNSEDWPKWEQAMQEEMDALDKNNTWELVDRPLGCKPVKNKWVFKVKLDTNGDIERYKARLVAKGYSQIENVDYKETFAPVASMNTIRILFAVANQRRMEILQFDVKTAFLHGDLDETIYMEYPEGMPNPANKVCKLIKSLYGLKQAPRQWNKKFDDFLRNFNLVQSRIDKCLYFDRKRTILVAIYVDDGLVASTDGQLMKNLVNYLKNKLELKVMECESYLGFQVIKNPEKRTIKLQQSHYVDKILEKFTMTDCKPIYTPEEVGLPATEDAQQLTEDYPFKELVGSLLYLVTCTRPDIAHAVSIASRTSKPTIVHWKMLKRILRYLKGTKDIGICFRWEKFPRLVGYSDADYANDIETRRSNTGFCIMYCGGPIAWRCQRQSIVSLSTAEAEYISGCDLVKELLPIRELMIEILEIPNKATTVLIDNQSAVKIAQNEGGQQRTKHIDVREKWLNEQHSNGKITVKHISGDQQVADILTKPLHKTKFINNRNLLLTPVALLSLICCVTAYNFVKAPPVFFAATPKPYIVGNKDFDLSIVIVNPCESFFNKITPEQKDINQLTADCNDKFKRKVISKIEGCRAVPKPVLDPIEQKKRLERLGRQKRVPLVPIAMGIIWAGNEIYSYLRTSALEDNAKALAENSNQRNIFLAKSMDMFNATRNSIIGINSKIVEIEKRLDFLDKRMDSFPKIAALVTEYESMFNEAGELLGALQDAAQQGVASKAVMKLAKEELWKEPASKWSTIQNCEAKTIENGHLEINYAFRMPVRAPNTQVLRATYFNFWNQSSNGGTYRYCYYEYSGPKLILYNETNHCFRDIAVYNHDFKDDDEIVMSQGECNQQDGTVSFIYGEELYEPRQCSVMGKSTKYHIKIREFNGYNYVYCRDYFITIGEKEHTCPTYIFELPSSESFMIKAIDMKYTGTRTSKAYVNTMEMKLNKEIISQIAADSVRIYGTPEVISVNQSFANLREFFSNITTNISMKQVTLPDIVKEPIKAVRQWSSWFWDMLEKGVLVVIIFGILVMMVLAAPCIEILIFVFAKAIRAGSWITKCGLSIKTKAKSKLTRSKPTKSGWRKMA